MLFSSEETMKYDWRKEEKTIYAPKAEPQVHTIPKQTYITIKGEGNPNEQEFADRVEVLYALAYGIRMAPRNGVDIEGYYDYGVYPLEGIWSTKNPDDVYDKSKYTYTIMIRQPDFVNQKDFDTVLKKVKLKKNLPLLDNIKFEELEDGKIIQILHNGTYDNETASFNIMKEYMKEHGLKQRCFEHREIYLNDSRKTAPDKLKTILRYFLEEE